MIAIFDVVQSDAVVAPNTLDRAFNLPQPNCLWASDITDVRTHESWLYLAVVIDLFSRWAVGWSIQPSMHTEIVMFGANDGHRSTAAGITAAPAFRSRLAVHERRLPADAAITGHQVQLQ